MIDPKRPRTTRAQSPGVWKLLFLEKRADERGSAEVKEGRLFFFSVSPRLVLPLLSPSPPLSLSLSLSLTGTGCRTSSWWGRSLSLLRPSFWRGVCCRGARGSPPGGRRKRGAWLKVERRRKKERNEFEKGEAVFFILRFLTTAAAIQSSERNSLPLRFLSFFLGFSLFAVSLGVDDAPRCRRTERSAARAKHSRARLKKKSTPPISGDFLVAPFVPPPARQRPPFSSPKMVKKAGGRELNPANAEHKAARAKEVARNKKARQLGREAGRRVDDPESLKAELYELAEVEAEGKMTAALRLRKKALQTALAEAVRRRKEASNLASAGAGGSGSGEGAGPSGSGGSGGGAQPPPPPRPSLAAALASASIPGFANAPSVAPLLQERELRQQQQGEEEEARRRQQQQQQDFYHQPPPGPAPPGVAPLPPPDDPPPHHLLASFYEQQQRRQQQLQQQQQQPFQQQQPLGKLAPPPPPMPPMLPKLAPPPPGPPPQGSLPGSSLPGSSLPARGAAVIVSAPAMTMTASALAPTKPSSASAAAATAFVPASVRAAAAGRGAGGTRFLPRAVAGSRPAVGAGFGLAPASSASAAAAKTSKPVSVAPPLPGEQRAAASNAPRAALPTGGAKGGGGEAGGGDDYDAFMAEMKSLDAL